MDIRSEIQATYRQTLSGTGDRAGAYSTASDRFADLASYVPPDETLDSLLQGALLGREHILMRRLDGAPLQEHRQLGDPAPQALRLRST